MNASLPKDTQKIFLHGWGQSANIWQYQHGAFKDSHFLDLPGHGGQQTCPANIWLNDLENQITQLAQDKKILLIGWSLGGQLAIRLEHILREKNIICGLVLIATTPCFRQKSDWSHGCTDSVWHGFEQASNKKDPKLMARFFQMMLQGEPLSRAERNNITKQMTNKQSPPTFEGLIEGLNLLSKLDLRVEVSNISVPTLIIHGQQDVIVPVQASHYLTTHIPKQTSYIFEDCGHAPFLTHHAAFNALLEQWWKNISV